MEEKCKVSDDHDTEDTRSETTRGSLMGTPDR